MHSSCFLLLDKRAWDVRLVANSRECLRNPYTLHTDFADRRESRGAFERVDGLKNQWRNSHRVGAQFHWAIAVLEYNGRSRRQTLLLQEPVAAEETQNQTSQRPTLSNAP